MCCRLCSFLSFQVLKGIFTEILNAISIVCGFCSLGWQPNKTETQNMIAEYTDYSCTNIMLWVLYLEFPSFLLLIYCMQGWKRILALKAEVYCTKSLTCLVCLFIRQARFPCVLIVILDLCTKDAICNGYWGDKGKRSTAKLKYQ